MTICLATPVYYPAISGIATYTESLARLLVQTGHTVLVLTIDDEAKNKTEDSLEKQTNGITVVRLSKTYHYFYKKYKYYYRDGGFNAAGWIATGYAMQDWLNKNHQLYNIDIIEAADYGGTGIFLCSNHLPPVAITGHGSLTQLAAYNPVPDEPQAITIKQSELLSFQKADAVIAYSRLNQSALTKWLQRKTELATAPFIITNEKIAPAKEKDNYFLVTGGLQPVKGCIAAIEAMQYLQSKDPSIQLKWIGTDTWMAEGHSSMAAYLKNKHPNNWNKNFIWLGKTTVAENANQVAAANAIIVPSFWETFNYTAIEAAAMNKAVLITENIGAAYLFEHGVNAWIIKSNDPAALGEAMLYLKNNPTLCRELGNNAKQMVEKTFAPDKIAAERITIYQQTIKNRKAQTQTTEENLSFLKKYTTQPRKYYYQAKAILKRMIGR